MTLKKFLECLELTHEKWIDLCILFGCDYLKRIRGMVQIQVINLLKTILINLLKNYYVLFRDKKMYNTQ